MSGYTNRIEVLFSEMRKGLRQKFEARISSESGQRYELVDLDVDDVDVDGFQVSFAVRCLRRNDRHVQRVALAVNVGTDEVYKNLELVAPVDSVELQDLRNGARKKEADFWEGGQRYSQSEFSEADFIKFAAISPRGATVVQSATFGRSENVEGLMKVVRKICEITDEEIKEIRDSPLSSAAAE